MIGKMKEVVMSQKVLVVDDEKLIVKGIKFSLEQDQMEVDCAYDGEEAVECVRNKNYDIVLLDLMLPKLNGYEVCQQIREFSDVPIIMLTAKGETMDKIAGLDSGADDYMTKPFSIEELFARMRVVLRRRTTTTESDNVLVLKDLKIDLARRMVHYGKNEIELTKREFELLVYLVKNKNIVISREQILNQVWGYDYIGETNVVDVYVRYLRTKIDDKFGVKLIHTIRGVGYFAKDED